MAFKDTSHSGKLVQSVRLLLAVFVFAVTSFVHLLNSCNLAYAASGKQLESSFSADPVAWDDDDPYISCLIIDDLLAALITLFLFTFLFKSIFWLGILHEETDYCKFFRLRQWTRAPPSLALHPIFINIPAAL
jgi:hypothetical protein